MDSNLNHTSSNPACYRYRSNKEAMAIGDWRQQQNQIHIVLTIILINSCSRLSFDMNEFNEWSICFLFWEETRNEKMHSCAKLKFPKHHIDNNNDLTSFHVRGLVENIKFYLHVQSLNIELHVAVEIFGCNDLNVSFDTSVWSALAVSLSLFHLHTSNTINNTIMFITIIINK